MKKITMKNLNYFRRVVTFLILVLFLIFSACNEEALTDDSVDVTFSETDGVGLSSDSSSGGTAIGSSEGQGNGGDNSGLVTAGEWNDLENWNFWNDILNENEYFTNKEYWGFYSNNRISVQVNNNNVPLVNAKVEIRLNNEVEWKSMTDNFGKAELFISLFNVDNQIVLENYKLYINDIENTTSLKFFDSGIVEIQLNSEVNNSSNKVEIAFIVDATGSMGDELEFLKDDLKDVIQRSEQNNSALDIFTGTVFYRDINDDYLVKSSGFTNNIDTTLEYIKSQYASGGGDYPEAVNSALNEALTQLQWSLNSKTRIAFLLLDAPPHHNSQIVEELHDLVTLSAEKGIKIIPVTASGIDKETEFLMRFFSVSTNGTYVFITNDSGIGNDHIEASVGEYEVENLNDLLVRLINKYSSDSSN